MKAASAHGLPSPSCGFPVGVFWNFTGDATLWAHEIGHNRHYEHSADAQQKPPGKSARPQHDSPVNAFITHGREGPENKGWDRACLMSYVSQLQDLDGTGTSSVRLWAFSPARWICSWFDRSRGYQWQRLRNDER